MRGNQTPASTEHRPGGKRTQSLQAEACLNHWRSHVTGWQPDKATCVLPPCVFEEHVPRLDVLVDGALPMDVLHGVHKLQHQWRQTIFIERLSAHVA